MDIHFDKVVENKRKEICSDLLDTMKNCMLSCTDNTKNYHFEKNPILKSIHLSECDNIEKYKKELSNYGINMRMNTNILYDNRKYYVHYNPQYKVMTIDTLTFTSIHK